MDAAEFDKAEKFLEQASQKDIEAAERLKETANSRLRSAAESKAEIGDLRHTQLDYKGAATFFKQAADIVPENDQLLLADYLQKWSVSTKDAGQYDRADPKCQEL